MTLQVTHEGKASFFFNGWKGEVSSPDCMQEKSPKRCTGRNFGSRRKRWDSVLHNTILQAPDGT
jgi:hypothetical protein